MSIIIQLNLQESKMTQYCDVYEFAAQFPSKDFKDPRVCEFPDMREIITGTCEEALLSISRLPAGLDEVSVRLSHDSLLFWLHFARGDAGTEPYNVFVRSRVCLHLFRFLVARAANRAPVLISYHHREMISRIYPAMRAAIAEGFSELIMCVYTHRHLVRPCDRTYLWELMISYIRAFRADYPINLQTPFPLEEPVDQGTVAAAAPSPIVPVQLFPETPATPDVLDVLAAAVDTPAPVIS